MACSNPQPKYINPPFRGIKSATSVGDGYSIDIYWFLATSDRISYSLAYNVYFATDGYDLFNNPPANVITSQYAQTTRINDLNPGQMYWFGVRATEFPIDNVDHTALPSINGNRYYPTGALLSNITQTSLLVPVQDISTFPPYGIVVAGREAIGYSSISGSNLVLNSLAQRGLFGTEVRIHNVDGYDGYYYQDPLVSFFRGFEDDNTNIMTEEAKAEYPYYPMNQARDGYKEVSDIVYTDMSSVDADTAGFDRYDYSGYHRTSPVDLLSGKCVGSYYGGEAYCVDGYTGIGRRVRGQSFADHQNQREEVLITTTGSECVLLRRQVSGKVSNNYTIHRENSAYRGTDNYGTEFVVGYEQFFNTRRSDGRIMVRFGPTKEDVERTDSGIENKFIPDCWIIVYPSIKDGDALIRYNKDGSEEFRYEITDVTRNVTLLGETGMQKFTAVRVRKTDPIYQFNSMSSTATIPTQLTTSVAASQGVPVHTHKIMINEAVTSIAQITQTTSISQGHAHPVVAGIVTPELGHTHTIIL